MAIRRESNVLRTVRRAALMSEGPELTDGELLEGYLGHREEAFFEALLLRHGPMVLGVCRRVLRSEEDAHDAFQATFLVFIRKAVTIVPRAMVGNWLHGVAYKTALKALAMNQRRRSKESNTDSPRQSESASRDLQDRLELLDDALNRLPAKYRSAIVLCELEGKTIKEASAQLKCPAGTVASRLAAGRALLAKRLARSGLCLTAATISSELARAEVLPRIPLPLIASTMKAAATIAAGRDVGTVMSAKVVLLTERVVKAMFVANLKTIATVLLVTMTLGGATNAFTPTTPKAGQGKVQAAPGFVSTEEEKPKSDKELLQGTWIPVSGEQDGKAIPKEKLNGKFIFKDDKFTLQIEGGESREGTYTIDPEKKPKELDLTFGNNTVMGLYELKDGKLKYVGMERGRPTDFDSTGATLVIYEKMK